jgi:hypothetical protein
MSEFSKLHPPPMPNILHPEKEKLIIKSKKLVTIVFKILNKHL